MEKYMIDDLIKRTRSIRRFDESFVIERKTLEELVDLARLSASARNRQPLKYILSVDKETNDLVFSTLTFAAALKDWSGPREGERPAAYIVVLGDTSISSDFGHDCGIACQSIMLGACSRGLGGCMMGSVDRRKLRDNLKIPDRYEVLLVLALGKPAEEIVIEPLGDEGSINYWRDNRGVHHVPKRSLGEIILELA